MVFTLFNLSVFRFCFSDLVYNQGFKILFNLGEEMIVRGSKIESIWSLLECQISKDSSTMVKEWLLESGIIELIWSLLAYFIYSKQYSWIGDIIQSDVSVFLLKSLFIQYHETPWKKNQSIFIFIFLISF